MFEYLKIKPGAKIASVGCGGGLWEVVWSFDLENVAITLQDINTEILNYAELKNTIQYFEKLNNKPTSSSFNIVIGKENQTNLPSNHFDKILLINSLHEFEHQKMMLKQCQKSLVPNGQLIIQEQMATHLGELHGCGKPLFLKNDLIDTLISTGFKLINSQILGHEFTATFSIQT